MEDLLVRQPEYAKSDRPVLVSEVKVPLQRYSDRNPYYVWRDLLSSSSVVYSVGIGSDFTFDDEISEDFGLRSFAFDPTPQSLKVFNDQERRPGTLVQFFNVGLSDKDENINFTVKKKNTNYMSAAMRREVGDDEEQITLPVRSVISVMKELRHSHIDVLRMDAEGAEFKAIPHLFAHRIYPTQLIIEIHYKLFNDYQRGRPDAWFDEPKELLGLILGSGYKVFHVSERGTEISFIRDFLL